MKPAFADTSFYVALANRKDTRHKAALDASDQWNGSVITTEYVLLELGNYFRGPYDRKVFIDLIEALRKDAETTIVPASPALFEQGFLLYARRLDKGWSLTDCVSFVVMESHGIAAALTCDRHFEQAGFQVLLAP